MYAIKKVYAMLARGVEQWESEDGHGWCFPVTILDVGDVWGILRFLWFISKSIEKVSSILQ